MLDYVVVGLGLAGVSFCEQLLEHNMSFAVIDDNSQQSSIVAGGLYNPVILKRFSMAWRADVQMKESLPFYTNLENKLEVTLDYKVPVMRIFASIEEQNLWFEATDNPRLQPFLSTSLVNNRNTSIHAPYGLGEVLATGRVDTRIMISSYSKYLHVLGALKEEKFVFEELEIHKDSFRYKGLQFKKIVFATGFGLKKNPFFNYLPLNGTKGELLTIEAKQLQETKVIKSSVFIIPIGDDRYRVGATYKWKDKSNATTQEAREELLTKLNTFLKCSYEVKEQHAGIRPTVADRRPLIGAHPEFPQMYLLNGFGSRGVLIAPFASKRLFDFIENETPLDMEMDIERYRKKYKRV